MKHFRFPFLFLLAGLIMTGILIDSASWHGDTVSLSPVLPEPHIRIPATTSRPELSSLNARYACVMDSSSGRPLYGKDLNKKVPMASTTKIMTSLLVLEGNYLSDTVTASKKASSMPKVHLGMQPGLQYRMSDLLYSLMLESHNDTAVAIAEHIGHSVEGFAALMNEKAKKIGLHNTHFVTPNGLDANGHYSTAEDMCLLARYAIKNKAFLSLVQTRSHTFTDLSGRHPYSLSNKDAFLSYYDGALGIKTGFTNQAGYCFVGAARRSRITLTSCVLASGWPPNKTYKWADTKQLMDYGFANFYPSKMPVQDLSQSKISVIDGKKKAVSLSPLPDIPVLLSRSDELAIDYDIPYVIHAPIRKNIPVGSVSFYINNKLYRKEMVFPIENIEKSNFSDTIDNVLQLWMEIFGF